MFVSVAVGVFMNLAAMLGAMGTNGDKTVGHLTPGEMVIPREVIDNNPSVMAGIIKAFSKAKLDWREFQVGGPDDKRNKNTGMRAFYDNSTGSTGDPGGNDSQGPGNDTGMGDSGNGGTENSGGLSLESVASMADMQSTTQGMRGDTRSDAMSDLSSGGPGTDFGGASTAPGLPSWDQFYNDLKSRTQLQLEPTSKNPGAFGILGQMVPGVGTAMTATAIAQALGIPSRAQTTDEMFADMEAGQSDSIISPARVESLKEAIKSYYRPEEMTAPASLGLTGMTPQQQRTAIATRATQGSDPRFRDVSAYDFYDNLLQRALIDDQGNLGDLSSINPIDESLLSFRGLPSYDSTASLLDAIAAA